MNENRQDALLEELSALAAEVPPMPEDAHAGWMQLVKEDAMMNPERIPEKKPFRIPRAVTRLLSAAAALVFVVGGTLMSKDILSPERETTYQAPRAKSAATYDRAGGDNGLYLMSEMAYDADTAEYEAVKTNEGSPETTAQKIIRTASLSLATREFDVSCAKLRELCAEKGGWISYSSESVGYNGLRNAWYTLRIPSEQLDAFLAATGGVGRVTDRSESANDVTESYYDTASRLATKQALLERLLTMTTDAADLSDLLSLESKIADVQYDIDRLQGSLNHTDSQVNYATVDVSVREEADADAMQVKEKTLGERLVSALSVGWEAFGEFLGDMIVFLAAALPFIAVVAVIAIAAKLWRRKRRK